MAKLASTFIWTCRCIIAVVLLFFISICGITFFSVTLYFKTCKIEQLLNSLTNNK